MNACRIDKVMDVDLQSKASETQIMFTPHTKISPRFSSPAEARHQALIDNTRKWVSGAFFGTLLKQMHESPFKSDLWDGGRGGQAFSTLYDQRLTERMSHGVGQKLVNAIVRKIEGPNALDAKQASAAYKRQSASVELKARAVAPIPATLLNNTAAWTHP
jgi:Rod binding domain-containing protein